MHPCPDRGTTVGQRIRHPTKLREIAAAGEGQFESFTTPPARGGVPSFAGG